MAFGVMEEHLSELQFMLLKEWLSVREPSEGLLMEEPVQHEGLGLKCTVFSWIWTDISREQNVFFQLDLDTKLTFLPLKRLLRGQEALRKFDGSNLHPAKRWKDGKATKLTRKDRVCHTCQQHARV